MIGDIVFTRNIISPQANVASLNTCFIMQYFLLNDQTNLSNTSLNIYFRTEVSAKGNIWIRPYSKSDLKEISLNAFGRLNDTKISFDSKINFKDRILVNSIRIQNNINNLFRKKKFISQRVIGSKQFIQNLSIRFNADIPQLNSKTLKISEAAQYDMLSIQGILHI